MSRLLLLTPTPQTLFVARRGSAVSPSALPLFGVRNGTAAAGIDFAWSVGLLASALVLRYGLGVENLAWALIFAIAPVSGVYYPRDLTAMVMSNCRSAAFEPCLRRHASGPDRPGV